MEGAHTTLAAVRSFTFCKSVVLAGRGMQSPHPCCTVALAIIGIGTEAAHEYTQVERASTEISALCGLLTMS